MIEKLNVQDIINRGFEYKNIYYNLVEEDMDWANQDKSYFRFIVNEGRFLYAEYKILIRPTYIWGGNVDRKEVMLVEKKSYLKICKKLIKRERLFRASNGILQKHLKDIYSHIIKNIGSDFRDKELLEIFVRDFNNFFETGVKHQEDKQYSIIDGAFNYNHQKGYFDFIVMPIKIQ